MEMPSPENRKPKPKTLGNPKFHESQRQVLPPAIHPPAPNKDEIRFKLEVIEGLLAPVFA